MGAYPSSVVETRAVHLHREAFAKVSNFQNEIENDYTEVWVR